jgi:DNA (cytosine-5)-methyltransferase 1
VISVGTYFTGGGVAFAASPINRVFAVEYDAAIADVYALNFASPIIVARVQDIDPLSLPECDVFQASPVCKNFSQANNNRAEGDEERTQAVAICRYLVVRKPKAFILENVTGYLRSKSLRLIIETLMRLGYRTDMKRGAMPHVLNSADYGVPQTRERMILRACRDVGVPQLPEKQEWRGWYSAAADIIDTFPADAFAEWQLKRLGNLGDATAMISGLRQMKRDCTLRLAEEPATVVDTTYRPSHMPKAFLLDGSNAGRAISVRHADSPMLTLDASGKGLYRAFLVDCTHRTGGDLTVREDAQPAHTIASSHMRRLANEPRAFIVDGQANDHGSSVTVRHSHAPVFAVSATANHRPARAWLSQGRVVRITERGLARFQTLPDSYILPEKKSLACEIIGNGIPSLLGEMLLESLMPALARMEDAA